MHRWSTNQDQNSNFDLNNAFWYALQSLTDQKDKQEHMGRLWKMLVQIVYIPHILW